MGGEEAKTGSLDNSFEIGCIKRTGAGGRMLWTKYLSHPTKLIG